MSKTIQINPDLFNISNSTTRKKSSTPKPPKIELKSSIKTQKQKTLRKNVLKMIREKQQEAYRELFDKKKRPDTSTSSSNSTKNDFDNSFDSSLEFFSSLANKVATEPNATLKNYDAIQSPIVPTIVPNIPPLTNITDTIDIPTPNTFSPNTISPIKLSPTPSYGCLKNGTLPTYRTYTRKNYSGGTPPTTQINESFITDRKIQPTSNESLPIHIDDPFDKPLLTNTSAPTPIPFTPKFIEQSQKFDKIHQGKVQPSKAERKIRYKKRKKIFKRTYRIGRSKTEPTIGVLVSNKTIRNRISTEAQLLKQTPIQDVRRFLIKKGFIKVGTNAPNDVLRKMYETVSLVCGEIQNHNPENLLYNFVNDKE